MSLSSLKRENVIRNRRLEIIKFDIVGKICRTISTIMVEKYKAIYNSITNIREKSSLQWFGKNDH